MYILVEEKIQAAMKNGSFDHLPGKGEPIELKDELQGLSPEIKQAYRILDNAGYISKETAAKKKEDITSNDLLSNATGRDIKDDARKQENFNQFIHDRKLHKNKKYPSYARKIYNKIFKR